MRRRGRRRRIVKFSTCGFFVLRTHFFWFFIIIFFNLRFVLYGFVLIWGVSTFMVHSLTSVSLSERVRECCKWKWKRRGFSPIGLKLSCGYLLGLQWLVNSFCFVHRLLLVHPESSKIPEIPLLLLLFPFTFFTHSFCCFSHSFILIRGEVLLYVCKWWLWW